MSLCENDCEYNGYNLITKKSICQCYTKINFLFISEIKFDKKMLLDKFLDIKNTANIYVMKCYKKLFKKEGIIYNIGFYIQSSIIIISIILMFLFIKEYKNFNYLINTILNVNINRPMLKNKNINFEKSYMQTNENNIEIKNKGIRRGSKKVTKKIKSRKSLTQINTGQNPPIKNIKISRKKTESKCKNNQRKKNKKYSLKINLQSNSKINLNDNQNESISENKNKKNLNNNCQIYNYIDNEINILTYDEAIRIDKRTYTEFYISLIKLKHPLIFSFITKNDYNPKIIKIILFLFSFSLSYTINSLFFTDSTIHNIYFEEGKYDFIYQLPKILYSTIISSSINTLLLFLSLPDKKIIDIKNIKDKEKKEKEKINLFQCLKIKFTLFFILYFLFQLLFLYYLSCFCVVYNNTQIYLIKDQIITFTLSLIYPFFLCLIPGIFRIPSLRDKNKDAKCFYFLSKLIYTII